jgi:FXSXX-COOH protein
METKVTGGDVETPLINLDEVPLGEILARQDTALAQAIGRIVRPEEDGDELIVAGFGNLI